MFIITLVRKIENEIGKRYGQLAVIKKIDKRERETSVYLWKCDCGNDCIASTSCLVSSAVTSCGCKNEENKANIRVIDNGLVDGTRASAISKSRKINKNNTSGYIGVSYSKEKKKWDTQITFQIKNHLIGRFDTKREAIKARKEAEHIYFDKYRK